MNESEIKTTPTGPVTKTPRKRKASTPRAPRVPDPEIAAINEKRRKAVNALRESRKSGKRLATILKLAEKLTDDDGRSLLFTLNTIQRFQLQITTIINSTQP